MKTGRGIILCVAAALLIFSCKKEAPQDEQVETPVFNFTVLSVSGNVKIISASGEKKASSGDIIAVSDTITTGRKSIADLTYGSSGIIRISENSRVAVAVIAGAASSESILNLDRGRLFLTLGKLQNTGFRVRTATIVASVRGTSFIVSADVARGARLAVMKGTVTVIPVKKGEAIEGKEISVGAGQKIEYLSSAGVDRILAGGSMIAVKPMTEAEIIEVKEEAADLKVDEIKGLDENIRAEVTKDVIEADPKTIMKQAKEEADKQQDNFDNIRMKIDEKNAAGRERDIKNLSTDNTDISSRVDERKQAEKQRKLEEDKKRQEEELLKKTEEMNQRARDRKEKASNIPTL